MPAVKQQEVADDGESGYHSLAEELGIDPRYTVVDSLDATGGLDKVVDPFVNMVYPRNQGEDDPSGVINNSNRWVARQRPDGSGIVESGAGTRVYGIRTAGGVVLGNTFEGIWFPYGSEYYEEPVEGRPGGQRYDYDWFIEVPYLFIGNVLAEQTDLDNVPDDSALALGSPEDTLSDGDDFMRGVVSADILDDDEERGVLISHTSGIQVYVGWDSTAHRGEEMFGFVPFDGDSGVPVPSARDALSLLRPNRAAAAGDDGAVRQGEWFLVPTTDDADGTIQKPGVSSRPYGGSPLDNHVPRDWRTSVDDQTFVERFSRRTISTADAADIDTPQDCVDFIHAHGGVVNGVGYSEVREMAEGVQVRGTVRHRESDHEMVSTDGWCAATTHDWEVMTVDDSTATWTAMYD